MAPPTKAEPTGEKRCAPSTIRCADSIIRSDDDVALIPVVGTTVSRPTTRSSNDVPLARYNKGSSSAERERTVLIRCYEDDDETSAHHTASPPVIRNASSTPSAAAASYADMNPRPTMPVPGADCSILRLPLVMATPASLNDSIIEISPSEELIETSIASKNSAGSNPIRNSHHTGTANTESHRNNNNSNTDPALNLEEIGPQRSYVESEQQLPSNKQRRGGGWISSFLSRRRSSQRTDPSR